MYSLSNHVALVTGAAGKGIGRSIALTLARQGASVIVNFNKSEDAANAIVDHIKGEGGQACAIQADIMIQNDCQRLVESAKDQCGCIDICIVNPGAGWHPEPIDTLDPSSALDDARRELAPLYHLLPLTMPGMGERGWGRVIAIAVAPPYDSPSYSYNVAKAARAHAVQFASGHAWSKGITLNVVSPGPISEIETLDLAIEQCRHGDAWDSRTTSSPQDVAESAAFLCSDGADYISGAIIPLKYH